MKNVKNSDRLRQEAILPLLFKLSIPAMISMFIQALYNVVDSIFVARLSKEALAAVSLAFPLQLIIISIGVGTGVGVTSLISRLLGEGNEESALKTAGNGLFLAFTYGLITTIVGIFFLDDILRLISDEVELIDQSLLYIKTIFLGSTAIYIPMISNNVLRGQGNTFIPMITMLIGAIANIILDPLLIFGIGIFPSLGVKGAAIATIISRILGGTFILYILLKGDNQLKISFNNIRYNKVIAKRIYIVGIPSMLMQMLASVMLAGLNIIIESYGPTAIAVVGIYFRLQSFVLMPVFGLAQGYMPIVGYNYGYKHKERLSESIKVGILTGIIITFIGFLFFRYMPDKFIMLFSDDKELLNLGIDAMKKISIAFLFIGFGIIGSVTFQAIGKGIPSLTISMLRQIVVLLPMAVLLERIGGLNLIWYAFPISEFVSAILIFIWLRIELKKVYNHIDNSLSYEK